MGVVVKTYTFLPKVTADASEVNSDFDTLYTLVNGNINSANIISTYTLKASSVDVVDAAGQFSSCKVEDALYELKVTYAGLSGATIQDFSNGLIGQIGSQCQQYAGHIWSLNEPNTTATEVLALYSFCAASLYNDVCATYNFTPGSNAPVASSGIMGLDNAVYFSGATGSFLYQPGTLLGTSMSAMCLDWWMAPADGQTVACQNTIFYKINNTANATEDRVYCYFNSAGQIKVYLYGNGSGYTLNSNYIFANGTCSWAHICFANNSSIGMRLYINGVLDAYQSCSNTQFNMRSVVAAGGTNLYVGVSFGSQTNSIVYPYQGWMSQFRVRNKEIKQKDLDIAIATKYTKPAVPDGLEADVRAHLYPDNISECHRVFNWEDLEVARDSATLYRATAELGGLSATDRLKIFVRS